MRFDYGKLSPRVEKLDNGIPVYLFPDPALDLVRLDFIFDAGSYFQRKPLQAGACCALTGAGTERYSADRLSEEMDFYGAYMERYSDRDQAFITFYSLSRYFSDILPFCEEAVKRSVFPQSELDTYLRKQHSKFLVNLQKVAHVARRAFYPALFGRNHPYGVVLEEDDFKRLTREDLQTFYKTFYNSENCRIVLSGSYGKEHLQMLNRLFGAEDWKGEKVTLQEVTPLREVPAGISSPLYVSQRGSLQEALMTGMRIMPVSDPGFAPFKVVDYILGGYFGSRLMRNIREDKGYTYGISSFVLPLRFSPVWMISSEVKGGCADKVLKEIEKEIRKLQKKEVDMHELELVRHAYMGEFMHELDGIFDIAERMKFFLSAGVDADFYRKQEEVLFSITPSQIKEYAGRFLNMENFTTVIVGGERENM